MGNCYKKQRSPGRSIPNRVSVEDQDDMPYMLVMNNTTASTTSASQSGNFWAPASQWILDILVQNKTFCNVLAAWICSLFLTHYHHWYKLLYLCCMIARVPSCRIVPFHNTSKSLAYANQHWFSDSKCDVLIVLWWSLLASHDCPDSIY